MSESLADVGHVDLGHVVAGDAGQVVVFAQPALLDAVFVATLDDGVFGQLGHIHSAEFVDLGGNSVLFDERLLGESKLQRIICGQTDVQTTSEVLQEWVALVRQEQRIVAQRTHRHTNLL